MHLNRLAEGYNLLWFLIWAISGINFLPIAKYNGVPLFQLGLLILILFQVLSGFKIKRNAQSVLYLQFVLVTLIALFVTAFFNPDRLNTAILTFIYSLIPILVISDGLKGNSYDGTLGKRLAHPVLVSMTVVVAIGWMLRLGLIDVNTFFHVDEAEFNLGYWGISYQRASRNHDYFYPLVGAIIAVFKWMNQSNRKYLHFILSTVFLSTLFASLSRGAMICSIVLIAYVIVKKKVSIYLPLLVCTLLVLLQDLDLSKYSRIFNSIFALRNNDSSFSNASRLVVWKDALLGAIQNPFGYGLDNYSAIYSYRQNIRISHSAENAFLTVLIERGVASLLILILFLLNAFRSALKNSSMNILFVPCFSIYLLFNYELNSVVAIILFALILSFNQDEYA